MKLTARCTPKPFAAAWRREMGHRRSSPVRRLAPLALAASLALGAGPALPADVSFDPRSNYASWSNTLNWDTQHLPGPNDNALLRGFNVYADGIINVNSIVGSGQITQTGKVTVASASSIGSLILGNWPGTRLSGTGSLTASGPSRWESGTIGGTSGNFTSIFNGGMSFDSGSDQQGHFLSFGTMVLSGNSAWNSGPITLTRAALVNNGQFSDVASGWSMTSAEPGYDSFYNSGTYRKVRGSTSISTIFTNDGELLVEGGSLAMSRGINYSTESGRGDVSISNGASLTLAASSSIRKLTLTNGTLTGSAAVDINQRSTWVLGTLTGSAGAGNAVRFNDGLDLQGTGTRTLQGRSVALAGNSTWEGGLLELRSGAVLTNNGSFEDKSGSGTNKLGRGDNSSLAFINNGSYIKSGVGTTTIDVPFTNNGAVIVKAGQLVINSPATNSPFGSLAVETGATLSFNLGMTLFGPSNWSGNGSITLTSGSRIVNEGSFTDLNTGAATLTGIPNGFGDTVGFLNKGSYIKSGAGVTTIATAFTNDGMLVVNAGTLDLLGTTAPYGGGAGGLTMTGGTLWGGGDMVLGADSTWSGGTLGNRPVWWGRYTLTKGLAISGSGEKVLTGRELVLNGSTSWTGNGPISLINASVSNNGGFTDLNTGAASLTSTTGSFFNNTGSYSKTGAGTSTVTANFQNTGILSVSAGTLDLSGTLTNFSGSTLTGGSFIITGPGVLKIGGNGITTNAAAITLDGSGAAFLRRSDGVSALAGLLSNAASGHFTLLNGASFTSTGVFSNAGQVSLGFGSNFTANSPALYKFENLGGASLALAGGRFVGTLLNNLDATVSGYGVLNGRVTNIGTVRATGGSLLAQGGISGPTGTVIIDAGASTTLSGSGSTVGTINNAGSLGLGTQNLVVSQDYTSTAFGTGNAFNRRAGVTGTGQIRAQGDVAQTLSGALIQLGNTANPTLTLPSLRVGDVLNTSFQVNNVGTSGPTLRGAIKTTGITSTALSGSAVTAQNWVAARGDSTGNFSLSYQPTVGQSLNGQVLSIVNNFDNVAGQTLSITGGKVYVPAVAQVGSTSPIDFGIVHVGDTVAARTIAVSNGASALGLNDVLLGTVSTPAGPFLASGSLAGLAPGAQDNSSLRVGLDTTAAGTFNGTASLAFSSHNPDMADLSLAGKQLGLQAQVNNYAALGMSQLGGAGSFSGGGLAYTLDFGQLRQGAGDLSTELAVGNVALGMADVLGVNFDLGTIASPFQLSGFGAITQLAAGASHLGLQISFSSLLTGHFDEVITLHAIGSNASGYAGALPDVQLRLVGQVAAVPELSSWAQLALGLMGIAGTLARRQCRRP